MSMNNLVLSLALKDREAGEWSRKVHGGENGGFALRVFKSWHNGHIIEKGQSKDEIGHNLHHEGKRKWPRVLIKECCFFLLNKMGLGIN